MNFNQPINEAGMGNAAPEVSKLDTSRRDAQVAAMKKFQDLAEKVVQGLGIKVTPEFSNPTLEGSHPFVQFQNSNQIVEIKFTEDRGYLVGRISDEDEFEELDASQSVEGAVCVAICEIVDIIIHDYVNSFSDHRDQGRS